MGKYFSFHLHLEFHLWKTVRKRLLKKTEGLEKTKKKKCYSILQIAFLHSRWLAELVFSDFLLCFSLQYDWGGGSEDKDKFFQNLTILGFNIQEALVFFFCGISSTGKLLISRVATYQFMPCFQNADFAFSLGHTVKDWGTWTIY